MYTHCIWIFAFLYVKVHNRISYSRNNLLFINCADNLHQSSIDKNSNNSTRILNFQAQNTEMLEIERSIFHIYIPKSILNYIYIIIL